MRILIEGNEDQAKAVSRALEVYARLCMGQLEIVAEMVRFDEIDVNLGEYSRMETRDGQFRAVQNAYDDRVGHGGPWRDSHEKAVRAFNLARSMTASAGVQDCLVEAKRELGYPANGSHGIANPRVPKAGKRAWEVKKVIDKALAEARNPNPVIRTVDYDGVDFRVTDDQAPSAKIVRFSRRPD